ncbi:MAG: aminotransferase class I/II-fold pyridoxal phosphate-dependent enzyme [Bacteroidetes bacterium]|nr:aminotransferase class I/II-fold pyridoxal phosphate-dependent enzyme [Bacteroidota bacterium]
MIIDLRSDTVTRPSPAMLEAMMKATVGDDVFEEDPTVRALEEKGAALFGKESALFCPSGTMCNQIAIKILTRPLDEIICDKKAHIYLSEAGGWAYHSGCSIRLIDGDRGRITAVDVLSNINAEDVHNPVSRIVAIENTHNKGGGSCYSLSVMKDISDVCRKNNLSLHLDGARIMNALTVTNDSPSETGKLFDTISFCLSKGLGAPIGSLLISSKENIKYARHVRKALGGGMRQAGYLAAAGIFALDNNIERLKDDHNRARVLGKTISTLNYIKELLPVETNIVIFTLNDYVVAEKFIEYLSGQGIKALIFGKNTIRFVTHLDIDDAMIEKTIRALKQFH